MDHVTTAPEASPEGPVDDRVSPQDPVNNQAALATFSTFTDILDRADYAHFHAISPEKQQRIMQAALAEFANKSYAAASTNAIVERAGISKGLLFHYFGDKQGLYLYLLGYVVQEYFWGVMSDIDIASGDLFDLTQRVFEEKLAFTLRHMLEARLYLRAMNDDVPAPAKELIAQSVTQAFEVFAAMTSLLDERRLRPGLDKQKVVQTINWAAEGLTNQLLATTNHQLQEAEIAQIMESTSSYFDFLRRLFYE